MERLVREEANSVVEKHACGGTHGLYALASARNARLQGGHHLRGQWLLAHEKVPRYAAMARALQNPDGSFSDRYFQGRSHQRDLVTRIGSSGHTLEFLMMALPQSELDAAWVRAGVGRVSTDLLTGKHEAIGGRAVGGMYHAVHALKLYRERTAEDFTPVRLQTAERRGGRGDPVGRDDCAASRTLRGSGTLPRARTAGPPRWAAPRRRDTIRPVPARHRPADALARRVVPPPAGLSSRPVVGAAAADRRPAAGRRPVHRPRRAAETRPRRDERRPGRRPGRRRRPTDVAAGDLRVGRQPRRPAQPGHPHVPVVPAGAGGPGGRADPDRPVGLGEGDVEVAPRRQRAGLLRGRPDPAGPPAGAGLRRIRLAALPGLVRGGAVGQRHDPHRRRAGRVFQHLPVQRGPVAGPDGGGLPGGVRRRPHAVRPRPSASGWPGPGRSPGTRTVSGASPTSR